MPYKAMGRASHPTVAAVAAEAAEAAAAEVASLKKQLAKQEKVAAKAVNECLPQLCPRDRQPRHTERNSAATERTHASRTFESFEGLRIRPNPCGNRQSKAYQETSRLQKLKTMSSKKDLAIRIRKEVLDTVDLLERDWNRIIAAMDAAQGALEAYEAEVEQLDALEHAEEAADAADECESKQAHLSPGS